MWCKNGHSINYSSIVSIIFWIGGVGFATIVIFPAIHGIEDPMARVQTFMGVERRFARLAKGYVIAAGMAGMGLFFHRGGFEGFSGVSTIMLGYKILVWLAFFVLLFGAEKRIMKKLISQQTAPEKAFKRLSIFHWFMLTLTIVAVACGVLL